MLELHIANKNYSSWSMRAWLCMQHAGLEFEERFIPLDQENTLFQIRSRSPSGRLPILYHDDICVWDSLAICEYIAEVLAPNINLWPCDTHERARARSLCAEMHAGFSSLRHELPMNIKLRKDAQDLSDNAKHDIARIFELWRDELDRNKNSTKSFLFGDFGIVDAYYAPVHLRFQSYGVPYPCEATRAYQQQILSHPAVKSWLTAAEAEPFALKKYD